MSSNFYKIDDDLKSNSVRLRLTVSSLISNSLLIELSKIFVGLIYGFIRQVSFCPDSTGKKGGLFS